jgi:oxygen-dependent protoporphyrinogen oxidase
MTVICAGYRRERVGHPLDGFGFLVPRTEGLRMLGCIWTSSVFDQRAPEGWVQLRTMVGGATDPAAVGLTDRELLQLFRREAGSLLAIESDPEFLEVYRWKLAIPQYTPGHVDRVRRVEAAEDRHPGLVLAGNAYRGVGLNDCVVSARRAVERVTRRVGG